jgi:hypothetical protein
LRGLEESVHKNHGRRRAAGCAIRILRAIRNFGLKMGVFRPETGQNGAEMSRKVPKTGQNQGVLFTDKYTG